MPERCGAGGDAYAGRQIAQPVSDSGSHTLRADPPLPDLEGLAFGCADHCLPSSRQHLQSHPEIQTGLFSGCAERPM